MKFVVVSTRSFSGGNIVLHLLCRNLVERGYDASILSEYTHTELSKPTNTILLLWKLLYYLVRDFFRYFKMKLGFKENVFGSLKCPKKILPICDENTIVIYPDVVYGNPFHAKNVVRWFLYHNRFPNNPEAYGKDELVFSFREHFNDYNLNPSCRLLTLNYFNKDLYKQTYFGERKGVCYIIRKGKNRPDLPPKFDGPIIDDLPEKEKVAVFNRCKYCYDYDTQTFYSTIAVVCGCIPIVVMERGKTKSDYLGEGDSDYGRAYGDSPEEIEYAIKTRQQCLQLLDFEESNKKNVDFFVKTVSEYFAEK